MCGAAYIVVHVVRWTSIQIQCTLCNISYAWRKVFFALSEKKYVYLHFNSIPIANHKTVLHLTWKGEKAFSREQFIFFSVSVETTRAIGLFFLKWIHKSASILFELTMNFSTDARRVKTDLVPFATFRQNNGKNNIKSSTLIRKYGSNCIS